MIKNTLDWYNGEIFEAKFILGFGLFLIAIAFLFYLYGNLPSAKVLLFPLLVIGIFFTAIGVGSIYSNSKKVAQIELKFNENQEQFIQSEIKRVEDFQYLYPMSIGISLFCFAVALGLLYFVKNIHWQAIAIALILFGSAFAIIDYFSKERATIYYEKLTHLKS